MLSVNIFVIISFYLVYLEQNPLKLLVREIHIPVWLFAMVYLQRCVATGQYLLGYISGQSLHVAEDQVTTGSGIFSAFFTFQLNVYDSLYSQALAFSQVPSGIALM